MICRYLRWKGFYGEDLPEPTAADLLARGEDQYSCLQTCQAWGPDDAPASPERCTGGRACHRDRSPPRA